MFRVKSLRLSSFRAVLEDLANSVPEDRPSPDEADSPTGSPARFEQFGLLLNAIARGSWNFVSPSNLSHLYAEARMGAAAEEPHDTNEAEAVAAQLRLRPRLTAQELRRIRRAFALANHPDRVPAPLRERATRRMVIANTLIDTALKALKADRL